MAIIFDSKRGKKAKAANNHVYSGFWLDKDATSLGDMFHGKNSTTVKALKLRKYQRAIANFVKILAQRDVPVVFKGALRGFCWSTQCTLHGGACRGLKVGKEKPPEGGLVSGC